MGDFSADIHYLMQEHIGKVVSEGLSVLYEQNPTHPVDFLAKWFLNYAATQKNREHAEHAEKKRQELVVKYKEHAEIVQKENEAKHHQKLQGEKVESDYRQGILEHEYHHELLPQSLANFIEKQKGFSGVYIGNYDHPTRQINEDQDEESAHIDYSAPRQINYIGASDSHHFMIGKCLPPAESEIAQTKTVTYEVFKEREAQQPVDPDADNPEPVVEKPIYYYEPDVTKQDRMYFFRIPRLGAYLACPLIYQSCLFPDAFDAGIEGRKKLLDDIIDFQERKKAKQDERDEKLAELEEGSEDYDRVLQEYNAEIDAMEPPTEAPFQTVKKEYVVCIDTLGQDREITEADRQYVEDLVKYFAHCWEAKEKALLADDITRHLELTKDLNYEEIVAEYTKRLDDEVDNKDIPQDADEQERDYHAQSARADFLRELFIQDEYRTKIKALTKQRVLKFPGIIQNALYLIGYEKKDIDLPGTNVLNWKVVKNLITDDQFFEPLKAYECVGPKTGAVEKYAYINRIQRRLDGLMKDIDEVDKYNLGLGVLLKFLKAVVDLRIKDIRKRRTEKERLREIRRKAIDDKKEWEEKREIAIAEALKAAEDEAAVKQAELDAQRQKDVDAGDVDDGDGAQDDEAYKVTVDFDEAKFVADWEELNKMPEIPDEVIEDIDLDLEPEEEPAQQFKRMNI